MKTRILLFIMLLFSFAAFSQETTDATIDKGSGILYFSAKPGTTPVNPDTYSVSEFAMNTAANPPELWVWNRTSASWERQFAISQGDTIPTTAPSAGKPYIYFRTGTTPAIYLYKNSAWSELGTGGGGGGTDDQTAVEVPFTPTGNILSSNVQSMGEELQTQIDAIQTTSGVVNGATNLGAFSGSTISDNTTTKTALQELETAVENVSGGGVSDGDKGDITVSNSGATWEVNTPELVPVILFIGESNSGGQASNVMLERYLLDEVANIQILNNTSLLLENLHIGVNNINDHFNLEPIEYHGWEAGLAKEVIGGKYGLSKIHLIKAGQGGSIISQWDDGGNYWTKFGNRIAAVKSELKALGKRPKFYIWISFGINDGVAATDPTSWNTDATDWISRIRTELEDSNAPVFWTDIEAENYGGTVQDGIDIALIQREIEDIAESDDNLYIIPTKDLRRKDNNHWSFESMDTIAQRMGVYMRDTIGLPSGRGSSQFTFEQLDKMDLVYPSLESYGSPLPIVKRSAVEFTSSGQGVVFKDSIDNSENWEVYFYAQTEDELIRLAFAIDDQKETPVVTDNCIASMYVFDALELYQAIGTDAQVATLSSTFPKICRYKKSGDDIIFQSSTDDGDTFTTHYTYTGVLSGISEVYPSLRFGSVLNKTIVAYKSEGVADTLKRMYLDTNSVIVAKEYTVEDFRETESNDFAIWSNGKLLKRNVNIAAVEDVPTDQEITNLSETNFNTHFAVTDEVAPTLVAPTFTAVGDATVNVNEVTITNSNDLGYTASVIDNTETTWTVEFTAQSNADWNRIFLGIDDAQTTSTTVNDDAFLAAIYVFDDDNIYHSIPGSDPNIGSVSGTYPSTIRYRKSGNDIILEEETGINTWTSIHTFTSALSGAGNDIYIHVYSKGTAAGVVTVQYTEGEGTPKKLTVNSATFEVTNTDLFNIDENAECVIESTIWLNEAKTVGIFIGTGTPESNVTAGIGSTYHRSDGGTGTSFYIKESGTGNTGWVAK